LKTIFFSRTSRPISIKFDTNHPWVKRIKDCSKEGPGSFPRGDNHRNAKISGIILKSSQEPLSQKSSYLRESFPI
jgi:hypothetical protein